MSTILTALTTEIQPRIESARTLLEEILNRKLEEAKLLSISEDPLIDTLRELLVYLKVDIRLYAISTEAQLSQLWDYFRQSEARLDFLLEVTAEWYFRLGGPVFDQIVKALGSAYGHQSALGVLDEDTYHRLPQSAKLTTLLADNHWFVTLHFLITLPLPNAFYPEKRGTKNVR